MTGLQRENVTKYAALSRNRCIIEARVGSSSYCLPAQGRTCLYESAAIEKMKPSKKTAEFIFTDILYFFPQREMSEHSALLVKWLNRDIGKKGP